METNKKELVYISGPMKDKPQGNRNMFDQTASIILAGGMAPVNPHDFYSKTAIEMLTRDEILATDLKILAKCDAIFLLPGWQQAEGAVTEAKKAAELGLKIYGFDTGDAVDMYMDDME